jgi:hypothetical protein
MVAIVRLVHVPEEDEVEAASGHVGCVAAQRIWWICCPSISGVTSVTPRSET